MSRGAPESGIPWAPRARRSATQADHPSGLTAPAGGDLVEQDPAGNGAALLVAAIPADLVRARGDVPIEIADHAAARVEDPDARVACGARREAERGAGGERV